MDELVRRLVERTGIDEATARSAVAAIFAFLVEEGPADKVQALLARIPGAAGMAVPEEAGDAPTLGGFGGLMGGGVMAVLSKLQGLGLGIGEIQEVTQETLAFAREKAGRDAVDEVIAGIPGLSQFV
ncbi:DUF2267 domain-containing protein [Propylenella binzhouense]|uniref:DUF2267 domain-containing protein n=1 Tax=Propylenella binzhouense TaxID=2555902 RepID=A0A964WTU0_9HYPH|nr:DUF2267 domain-containing protein [Propylenella binzhouense]MYZ48397.1 DUF2267 domain-containing protein [Propylenella binzhouense]